MRSPTNPPTAEYPPKAANAIVHALFTITKPNPKLPTMVGKTRRRTPAQKRAFWRGMERAIAAAYQDLIELKQLDELREIAMRDFDTFSGYA